MELSYRDRNFSVDLFGRLKTKTTFLDSVISGYPFPEIYVADGNLNLDTGQGTQLLVDGLQRVTSLVQYFTGNEELKTYYGSIVQIFK
jgi:uncharacterized protein with ParB-like and HNH nuclease domain